MEICTTNEDGKIPVRNCCIEITSEDKNVNDGNRTIDDINYRHYD